MIAILIRALSISLLISLVGCGVRGALYLPSAPPAPIAPSEPEPQGKLYPPPGPSETTPSSVKQGKAQRFLFLNYLDFQSVMVLGMQKRCLWQI